MEPTLIFWSTRFHACAILAAERDCPGQLEIYEYSIFDVCSDNVVNLAYPAVNWSLAQDCIHIIWSCSHFGHYLSIFKCFSPFMTQILWMPKGSLYHHHPKTSWYCTEFSTPNGTVPVRLLMSKDTYLPSYTRWRQGYTVIYIFHFTRSTG